MPYTPSNIAIGAAKAIQQAIPLTTDIPDALMEAIRKLEALEAAAQADPEFATTKPGSTG